MGYRRDIQAHPLVSWFLGILQMPVDKQKRETFEFFRESIDFLDWLTYILHLTSTFLHYVPYHYQSGTFNT